jgi:hypothetical protein
MSPAELREIARQQNDEDCARHGIPRYVEDPSVLAAVAGLLADVDHPDGERPVSRTVKPARARKKESA